MTIVLNGTSREVPDTARSVGDLLEHLALGAQPVVVERNGLAILRRDFASTPVAEGDVIEIVRMVAGG